MALFAFAFAALGQSAGQVTEDSFVPDQQRLTGALEFTGAAGLQAPQGADRFTIDLAGVQIDGIFPPVAAEAEALRAQLTRGRISVSEIFEAASAFEAAMAEAGFVLARVVVPQQNLRDGGVLRLQIVDGFVEGIDTQNVPPQLQRRMIALTDRLVGQRSLSLRELERPLLLAGDTYGVSLGSALSPGQSDGGTIITLDPDYRRFTGFVGVDTLASSQLGGYSIDTGLEANSLFRLGEVIYVRASGSPDGLLSSDPNLRTLAIGGVVPIGSNGLTLNVEGTQTETNVSQTGTEVESGFERVSIRVFYPWIRSRSLNLASQLSFDLVEDTQGIVSGAGSLGLHEDRLSVLRASINGAWTSETGAVTEIGAIASFGLDTAGARTAANVGGGTPLSRVGADATFEKLELAARHRRSLSGGADWTISGRAQTSFGSPLVISEQLGVATAGELSTFADLAGGLDGDSGWAVRTEVSYLMEEASQSLPFMLRPYLFGAAGQLILEAPQADEDRSRSAFALGIGVDLLREFDPAFSNANLRMEIGRGTIDDGNSDRTSVAIIGNYRF